MKRFNSHKSSRYLIKIATVRLSMIALILALILSACKPAPKPTPEALPETPTQPGPPPTPTLVDSGLAVTDSGEPLPPEIIELQPRPGGELSLRGEIQITFNQPMNPEKTQAAWSMTTADGSAIPGQITWLSPRTMVFNASEQLDTASDYRARLEVQATSRDGLALNEAMELEYTTVGELQVSQVFPANGALEVASSAVITVIFNRPVVPLVIAEEKDKLPNPIIISPEVPGSGEWVNTSVFAFHADQGLKGSTTYTVMVKAGLSDASLETQLTQDYSWQFSTAAPSIASFELSNGIVNPEDYYANVLLDEYFALNFLQPMNPGSTEAAFSLVSNISGASAFITDWNQDYTQVIITPTQRLALGASYTMQLGAQAQATDGGKLKEGLLWHFNTVPPPGIEFTRPDNGSLQDHYSSELMIKFLSPMNIESVKDKILITPAPEESIEWWYNDWNWSISAYILQPSTRYEVRILPGMQDIYGNVTNQSYTIRFTTAAHDPSAGLQMPYEPAVFRQGGPQDFYINYRNVDSVEIKLYSIDAKQFMALLSGQISTHEYSPAETALVWQAKEFSSGTLNERILKEFTPTTAQGQPLPPGFYMLTLDSAQVFHYGAFVDFRFIVVANANLTFKSTTNEGLVWLTGMESGKPIQDALISIYDNVGSPVATGTTDKDGLLYLELPTPPDAYQSRYAMANDGKVFAFASSQWGSGISTWDYGIWGAFYGPTNQPKAYVYTERPIYRPGQPVYFKGIVRLDDDLAYSLPPDQQIQVTISNYQEKIFEATLPLTSFGTFSDQFILDSETTLGYHSLEVKLPGRDEIIGSVGFTVAEYRKPEFQVKVAVEPTDVLSGDKFTATITADYYSGGGVADAEVEWTLTAEAYSFEPPSELSGYSFNDIEIDLYTEDYEYFGSEVIAQGQGRTDASGRFSITLPADLSEVKTGRRLTFEATVTDLSKNSVSGRSTVIAHRSAVYPGIRPGSYVGTVGDEQTFDIVAVGWSGERLPGQKVRVEVVERRWYSVQEQDATGRVQWKSTVEEIPVVTFEDLLTDANGEASVRFTPPKGGIYRARVIALDSRGNQGSASAYMWVAGKDFIPWRQTNDRSFDLVTDRSSYLPGDTAEILIASPFQGESIALVSVERGRIHYREVIRLDNNSTIYKLPITADMAPNAYVSVLIIKGVDEYNQTPNYKMGLVEINVDTRQQMITVELIPDRTQAGPGEVVQYTVRTLDYQGKPLSAEVSLSLSDLATLSLMPPNTIPILDYFYSKRTLGIWTSVPIGLIIEEYNVNIREEVAEGIGMGSGGAKGADDLGVVEVRQDFPDTAFWEAHLTTNQNGEATVTVKLPDNLTTWRMEARAVTSDTRVGQTTLDIISTKSLLVRPQTPRFFVAGDQARLGVAIHNNTGQALSVNVSLSAQGLSLQSTASQVVEIPNNQQAYVSWDVTVNPDSQRVDLIFSAEGGGFKDASRPPMGTLDNQGIPVYRYQAFETVGTSGQMTSGGSRLEAISLPEGFNVTAGQLTVQLSPSLAASMTDGLKFLESYPDECIEQTISRFLPNVITTRALAAAGLGDPQLEADLREQVGSALQRLYNWQNADGGWGWWRSDESDLLTSTYVALGLIEAQQAGYTISQDVLDRATHYLQSQLLSIVRLTDPELVNRQAFVLYVLARSSKPDVSSTVQLFEQRQRMALFARAFQAQTLYLIDPADPRIQTLLSDLASTAVYSASGNHWEEGQTDRWNWNTDTRTTAIVLSALSQIDPLNPLNANAVRWLMSHRTNGHWMGTQETAWTLMALTNWMVASGELQANFKYAVGLNGERLGGGIASPETLRQSLELQVDVSELLTDQINRLVIARDEGSGNLYYTAHLNVALPVEQISALDQGIIVSRSYYRLDDLQTPVIDAQHGELLLARLTIVAPKALHYVIVNDPLPAGLEAVDQSLSTSPQSIEVPQEYSWSDVLWRGWGWWFFRHIQLRDEKVVLSTNYLPAGTYIYTYLVRAGTVGVFQTIPPTAQEFYFPEVYGRGEGSKFTVNP